MYIRRIISPDTDQPVLYVSLFHFLNTFFSFKKREKQAITLWFCFYFNLKKLCVSIAFCLCF